MRSKGERWFEQELAGCRLGDGRLDRRLRQLIESMEAGFGESIPLACQDWAGTKAAYRFFSNDRVSEEEILRGHFDATRQRFAASDGVILILPDTTELTWERKRPEAVANRQLLRSITSPAPRPLGSDIREVWRKLIVPGRFRAIRVECLLSLVRRHASDPDWAAWMELRYGDMQ